MKVYYDKETDSAYIELSTEHSDGVIEITEGVNLDTTNDNKVIGIELLNASKKISLSSLLTFEIDEQLLTFPKAS